jgi:hypothetical protein
MEPRYQESNTKKITGNMKKEKDGENKKAYSNQGNEDNMKNEKNKGGGIII